MAHEPTELKYSLYCPDAQTWVTGFPGGPIIEYTEDEDLALALPYERAKDLADQIKATIGITLDVVAWHPEWEYHLTPENCRDSGLCTVACYEDTSLGRLTFVVRDAWYDADEDEWYYKPGETGSEPIPATVYAFRPSIIIPPPLPDHLRTQGTA